MLDSMIQPRSVPGGGTLGIFAGSGPFERSRLEAGMAPLEALGFRFVDAPDIDSREGFLAGSDEVRAQGVLELLERSEVDAIIAARGGYGLTRILDRLPSRSFATAQKWVVGFSDVTALHAHLTGVIRTVHGPVLTQLGGLGPEVAGDLSRILSGGLPPALTADGPAWNEGYVEGILWGGNLAVLGALCGTAYLHPPSEPTLLMLEDVGETTYRLDRQLTQLLAAGWPRQLVGVVLGDFHDCRPAQPSHPTALAVLEERLRPLGVPVVSGFPIGHGPRNRPVVLGHPYALTASGRLEPRL